MTLDEFRSANEGAPYDDRELAGEAAQISDHDLGAIARRYLAAMAEFEEALRRIDFERG